MPSFFLSQVPTHHSFTLICDSYMCWSTRFVSLKLCVGFSVFDSDSFLLKFIFLFNKMHGLKNVIIPFKIKVIEKLHTVLLPDLWFLSCNKKFENSMISAWVKAPQKLSGDEFFNLRKPKFWECKFFSIVTFN